MGKFAKNYGKVVGKDADGFPGWKGPSYVKKPEPPKPKKKSAKGSTSTSTETNEENDDSAKDPTIPIELQQLLLNIFRDAFPGLLTSDTLQPLLQEVKTALYERDFSRAFGKTEYLEAYSSPDCKETLKTTETNTDSQNLNLDPATHSADVAKPGLNTACFGGGSAEVLAFGGFSRYMRDASRMQNRGTGSLTDGEPSMLTNLSISDNSPKVNLLLLDIAQWEDVVQQLHNGLTKLPILSKYASAAARAANSALLADGDMSTTFRSKDVLETTQDQLNDVLGKGPMLLTLLFTLNELYTTSIGKTTAFLLKMTMAAKPGSLLLVVDSPGSYSETNIGTEAKKYPMSWLMNHTLLEAQNSKAVKEDGEKPIPASWVKLVSEDSKWFRMPEDLRYPIPLENMRYQVHLYKRV
ncbi:25S rRNA (uridine(2843)-N(3))-methyltransferase [Lachnellula hyalina]|uniref:25S rRNA (Uridine(2843)-N(3))-methyltransferase n=1 Tax=Lachnellula hyalina TaxID=1316788 RepID=A0A8H8R9Y8_9HELO|nr:25S rRNA (uridine(2843)-N(3))-methyltransferase [Lachnellula hyalina]TVY31131.1 25S rRNA (uridine(2843)-N(3))-methyltransferase [Lachnellula hyalina]